MGSQPHAGVSCHTASACPRHGTVSLPPDSHQGDSSKSPVFAKNQQGEKQLLFAHLPEFLLLFCFWPLWTPFHACPIKLVLILPTVFIIFVLSTGRITHRNSLATYMNLQLITSLGYYKSQKTLMCIKK